MWQTPARFPFAVSALVLNMCALSSSPASGCICTLRPARIGEPLCCKARRIQLTDACVVWEVYKCPTVVTPAAYPGSVTHATLNSKLQISRCCPLIVTNRPMNNTSGWARNHCCGPLPDLCQMTSASKAIEKTRNANEKISDSRMLLVEAAISFVPLCSYLALLVSITLHAQSPGSHPAASISPGQATTAASSPPDAKVHSRPAKHGRGEGLTSTCHQEILWAWLPSHGAANVFVAIFATQDLVDSPQSLGLWQLLALAS